MTTCANPYPSPMIVIKSLHAPATLQDSNAKICDKANSKPNLTQKLSFRLSKFSQRDKAQSSHVTLICQSEADMTQDRYESSRGKPLTDVHKSAICTSNNTSHRLLVATTLLSICLPERPSHDSAPKSRPMLAASSPLVKLELQIHVLGAFAAVVIGEAATFDCRVFAHIDAPGIV